ncbi:MAG: TCP-1/cpn60 chaperonin family protein [Rhodovibrio sp.]|nr:TCP-1/cpn60 chaperonin family protein [Rhodovibrio sp.]
MAAKEIVYDVEARNRLLQGPDQLADAVSVTLGPRGRTVILDEANRPFATKDGVTLAKAITLRNRMENAGAQLVRDVAGQTNDDVGDGTTSAIVMARELARRGTQAVATGVNATEVRRGMANACASVVSELQRQAQPVEGTRVEQVATIAANGDTEIGRLLAQAFERVGDDGAVSVEAGDSIETELDIRQGMQIESGYLSAHFVTHNERFVCEYDRPRVLLSAEKISSTRALLPFLEATAQNDEPLLHRGR